MNATVEQVTAIGNAARNLLQAAWKRNPRNDHHVVNGLTAVGKTFATDPAASAALFRRAIEEGHLRDHGYKELSWIARQIVHVAKGNPSLAVDIYRAAYGYVEESRDPTAMGASVLLPLQSNRRQDYESAWYGLAKALPKILDINLEAGVLAVVHGLDGYVRRERNYETGQGESAPHPIMFGTATTSLKRDYSHIWYRGGGEGRALQDGPKLLKTFDEYLERISGETGTANSIAVVIRSLSSLPGVPAAVWASLLIAGTRSVALYARQLFPLVVNHSVMLSIDTRHQLGAFIGAAYGEYAADERAAIEAAILSLPKDKYSERCKAILAGCIPKPLVATGVMTAYLAQLKESGQEETNNQPFKLEISSRPYDSDAYLAEKGVTFDEPGSAKLRAIMRELEEITAKETGEKPTNKTIVFKLGVMERLHEQLASSSRRVPVKLNEHATGVLAATAENMSRVDLALLNRSDVRLRVKRIFLFCARSANPHYDAKHERQFHSESAHWGGPSARTSAADGLMNLTRGETRLDKDIFTVVRKLARDRVPEVRLQIVQNLGMLHSLAPDWAWSEAEHALRSEVTRSVVHSALYAVSRLAFLDFSRAIRLAKIVLRRYRSGNGVGMAHCRAMAGSLIFDLHIYKSISEANSFAANVMSDVKRHAELIQNLIARYSENLLVGAVGDQGDPLHAVRKRTLDFYRTATIAAISAIQRHLERGGNFNALSEADQQDMRSMVQILDEVSLRLNFAAGASGEDANADKRPDERARLFWESQDILASLAQSMVAQVAHHLIETLEVFIPLDPGGVFALIASSVRSAERGGYSFEKMAADLIVRIVERYLADYRAVFTNKDRLHDLIDCLDIFVRAGWPAAQSLTFRLGEIWR